ncbi:RNA polymerase sigma-70 factor (ECF subfamily) [Pedobacter cryoconitis]|uniref:RNA polymerase sigma factor n=1 Tax=Pedobacter cryoconitis TaxID=188932 RepID=UPI00161575EB|nr:sigma-70 family RNA polymerase sigma factor [Pedobacter cryoconitis]MBB6272053.1 RNA polymerase sigma-70 factor (ECF subfamily) [Pedobacter cryoconitis]
MDRTCDHKIMVIANGDKSPGRKDCAELEIVGELKKQTELSFNKLYLGYASLLLGVILKLVPSREVAEDILQETFIKIWKSIDQYDADKGRLFTWMSCLARNTAKDYLKGKNFAKSIKNDDIDSVYTQVNNSHYCRYNTDIIGIRELIAVLSDSQKQILNLIYFQGYTQVEVSDELHIPLGTVKSKIRIAVKVLRCYFE